MDDDRIAVADAIAVAEFRSALRRFLRGTERVAQRAELTPQRYQLLLMIKGAPDGSEAATVGDLSRRLYLAQSTVTELVQRAQESGLVASDAVDPVNRTAKLRLTDEGERRLARAFTGLAAERHDLATAVAQLDEG